MAELLTAQEITALEAIQAQIKTDAAAIRTRLNALAATPENVRHNAFKALRNTYSSMKGAISGIEEAVVSNEDDYG